MPVTMLLVPDAIELNQRNEALADAIAPCQFDALHLATLGTNDTDLIPSQFGVVAILATGCGRGDHQTNRVRMLSVALMRTALKVIGSVVQFVAVKMIGHTTFGGAKGSSYDSVDELCVGFAAIPFGHADNEVSPVAERTLQNMARYGRFAGSNAFDAAKIADLIPSLEADSRSPFLAGKVRFSLLLALKQRETPPSCAVISADCFGTITNRHHGDYTRIYRLDPEAARMVAHDR